MTGRAVLWVVGPATETFHRWPIPSGGVHAGILRHMRPTHDGDLLIHQSSTNRIILWSWTAPRRSRRCPGPPRPRRRSPEVVTPPHATPAPGSLIAGPTGAIDERMSTMLVEIYDALKEAGASEEKARAAAASLTGRDDRRFDEVDNRLQQVEHRLDGVERRLGLIEQAVETLTTCLSALEERVAAVEAKVIAVAQDVAVIRAELGPMKWMHGITIGGVLALLIRTFFG